MTTSFVVLESPLGPILLTSDGGGLTAVRFDAAPPPAAEQREDGVLSEARAQLAAYFAGRLARFELPLHPRGTPFQRRVWDALLDVPYGETETYGALARRIGAPAASRAVGAANGRNPLGIVVPCHRVVGSDGTLTGYAGGLPRKRWLLEHERRGPVDRRDRGPTAEPPERDACRLRARGLQAPGRPSPPPGGPHDHSETKTLPALR